MVDFGEIIGDSARWTKTVLFKPFSARKWIILFFIAAMAGYMSNGCNFNLGDSINHEQKQEETQTSDTGKAPEGKGVTPESAAETDASASGKIVIIFLLTIVISLALFVVAVIIVVMWLGARFSFVFIENLIKNDELLRVPFLKHKKIGNSYFKFSLLFFAIFITLLCIIVILAIVTLAKAGIPAGSEMTAKHFFEILAICFPYVFVGIVLILSASIIGFIVRDFVVIAMFKDGLNVVPAFLNIWSLLKKNLGNFVLYILIKIGIGICAGIAIAIGGVACIGGLILPAAGIGLLVYLMHFIIPHQFLFLYGVLVFAALFPILLFFIMCLCYLNMPFGIFFRTFSIKFLAALDPRYNLFADAAPQQKEQQITKEEFSPRLSALLSFLVPGYGQVYNGQVKKGVVYSVTFWLIIPWIAGIIDAYNVAKKIRNGEGFVERRFDRVEPLAPVFSGLLSFVFPGAGQIYNGQPGKGALIFFTSGLIFPWVNGISDAFKTALRINNGETQLVRKTGATIAAIVAIFTFLVLLFLMVVLAVIFISISCGTDSC